MTVVLLQSKKIETMDNTNKNPIFSIKNFRSFGEDGADFELAPITVLTGCNSAGKSSLVKALLLLSRQLNDSFYTKEIQTRLPSTSLNVSSSDLSLGKFDKVLNTDASNRSIEFSYVIWSVFLQEMVKVKRVFRAKNNDPLNNGELVFFSIEKTDGTMIFQYKGQYDNSNGIIYYDSIDKNLNNFILENEYDQVSSLLTLLKEIKAFESDEEKEQIKKLEKEKKELEEQISTKTKGSYSKQVFEKWNEVQKKRHEKEELILLKFREHPGIENYKRKIEADESERDKELFFSFVNNEVIHPDFIYSIQYLGSSTASVERLYLIDKSNNKNNNMSIALRRQIERHIADKDSLNMGVISINYAGDFLNKWIQKFGIGDGIVVEGTDQGLGIMVFLRKENEKRLLADEGYGITQLTLLLLRIDNFIPSTPDEYQTYNPRYFFVEEPEIHLHPKYQSLLAEMFVEAYQKYNIHFIIETHSEYLIRKLQLMVADKENALTSNDVSLNYVEKNEEGVSHNRQIKILEDGRLSEPFGSGFYDEADTLAMELMKYKARKK